MNEISNYKVAKSIRLGDGSLIVLLDMLAARDVPLEDKERNVYRLNADGGVEWRVCTGDPVYPGSPFTGIGFGADQKLLAYRWDGSEYEIDVTTGAAIPRKLTK